MADCETKYGAVMERGVIVQADGELYTVASLERDGIETPPIPAVNETYNAGDRVFYFLFRDGTGMILPRALTRTMDETGGLLVIDRMYGVTLEPETGMHTFRVKPPSGETFPDSVIVTAQFLRADGKKVFLTGQVEENGDAVITLKPECYAVPGRVTLTIYVTTPTPANAPYQSTRIYAAEGVVMSADGSQTIVTDDTINLIDAQMRQIFDGLSAAHWVAVFARNIGDMEGTYDEILSRLDALESNYTALEARVTALEDPEVSE